MVQDVEYTKSKEICTVGKQHHKDVRRNCGYTQLLLAIFIVAICTGCGI